MPFISQNPGLLGGSPILLALFWNTQTTNTERIVYGINHESQVTSVKNTRIALVFQLNALLALKKNPNGVKSLDTSLHIIHGTNMFMINNTYKRFMIDDTYK